MGLAEHENAPADDAYDDLEAIDDIGRTVSAALHRIGIRRYADLARYTPHELSKLLAEQAGVKVHARRIETKRWIEQARALAQPASSAPAPAAEEAGPPPKEATRRSRWRQHAGFSLFFDFLDDERGEKVWQTRVYHEESQQEEEWPGVDSTAWVSWILERAHLPIAPTVRPATAAVALSSVPAPSPATWIDIDDVEVAEAEAPGQLMVEGRFQVSGAEAKALTAQRALYSVEIRLVDMETQAMQLVASEQQHLQAHVFEYTSRQRFPTPAPGRYELHCLVRLLPPHEAMAYFEGPIVKVIA
jgi:hypothetical protein